MRLVTFVWLRSNKNLRRAVKHDNLVFIQLGSFKTLIEGLFITWHLMLRPQHIPRTIQTFSNGNNCQSFTMSSVEVMISNNGVLCLLLISCLL